MTYRTRGDDMLTATNNDDFSTRSMNGGGQVETAQQPENPPASAQPTTTKATAEVATNQPDSSPSTASDGVTFNRLTSLPQPTLPDVAPLVAALATLDGQVSSLQEQLNATQEAMRNHETDIAQATNQLRSGVRNVSERMDATI